MPSRKCIRLYFILLCVLTISVSQVQGKVVVERTNTYTCVADAYVDSTNANSNYGSADLRVSFWTLTSLNVSEISFLAFFVTGLPSDAVISAVKLSISVKFMPYDDHSKMIEVYQTDLFDETTLTWENMPSINEADTLFVARELITSDSRWVFTLSQDGAGEFEAHTVTGNGNFYFFLMTTTDNSAAITFDSRDDFLNPPKLDVTYTSTAEGANTSPTTEGNGDILVLMIIGVPILAIIGGTIYSRRKRKRQTETLSRQPIFVSPKTGYCTKCGHPMRPNAIFCENCGTRKE
ncbi:MAG: DNRLRE domain-containing protein [Candidatus Thorarchaeota archaeon]